TTGGAGAGGTVKDCLPACIVNLRRGCERPNADAGASCVEADDGGIQSLCFSNGVKEVRGVPGDAATDPNVIFYNADHSVCYLVRATILESGTAQTIITTYMDPAGHVVGTLTDVGTPSSTTETATCGDAAVPPPAADPGCRMIDIGDCTSGACP
ncbi:MAG TPA: hypothetical protein VHC23_12530, partial [Jatrophihabitans sp.]|nr:hypothetical protein [Jatrophihabitans sp.]